MSIKENKALIHRIFNLYNQRELETLYKLIAPEAVLHTSTGDMSMEQSKQIDAVFFTSFPDVTATIKVMVAEGDKVAFQVTWRGTHQGEFMSIAPTGNKIEMTNTDIFRIAAGKVAEGWATMDNLSLMQQLGIIPPMGQK
jgi:predicted ester cyclase